MPCAPAGIPGNVRRHGSDVPRAKRAQPPRPASAALYTHAGRLRGRVHHGAGWGGRHGGASARKTSISGRSSSHVADGARPGKAPVVTSVAGDLRKPSALASGQDSALPAQGGGFGLKQAGKQALTYAMGVWATRASGFLLVPLYTRQMAAAHFGIYELLSRTFDLLCLILPAGMVMGLMRFYGLAEEGDKKRVASTAILCPAGIGALAAVVLWVLKDPIAVLVLRDRHYGSLVMLLGIWIWFELMFDISCALLRARGQAGLYTAANLCRSLLTVGLGLALVWWRHLGLTGVMLANVIGSGLPAFLVTAYALASLGLRFSHGGLVALVRFGSPLMATALLSAISGTSDRYILNAHAGPAQVAILGLAARVTMILSVLAITPISLTYTPFIFSTAKRPDAPAVFERALTYISVLMAGSALALALFAPEIVGIFAPAAYHPAVAVARVGLIASCLYGISPQIEIGIYLHGATSWKIPAFAVLVGVSLILNLVLIPRYGPIGAAFAQVGAQTAYLSVLYIVSQRLYAIPYNPSRLVRVALAAALPWAIGCGVIPGLPVDSSVCRVTLLAVFPLALWVLRVPDAMEAERIRRSASRLARVPYAAARARFRALCSPGE